MFRDVKFKHRTWELAGHLHQPPDMDGSRKYPALVCVHPGSSCKNQTAGIYAARMAERGFICLAFDASFQGESGGEPHHVEDPAARVEDIRCAVDYLVTLDEVDEDRIGILGVCAGGGYAVNAAMTERRIKAVGTVVAANLGKLYRLGDGSDDAAIKALEGIAAQRTAEARGADPLINPWIPNSPEECVQAGITEGDVIDAVQYYRTERGQHECSPNRLRATSMAKVMAFDAFHLVEELLTQPLQIIVGSKVGVFGSHKDGKELFERARSETKKLHVVEGASHYDLYDQPEPVAEAIRQLVPFYQAHL